jgi:hypothetical protein
VLALTVRKSDSQLEKTTRPNRIVLSGYSAFPVLDIENTLLGALRLGIETKRMVSSPLLPAWSQYGPGLTQAAHCLTFPLAIGFDTAPYFRPVEKPAATRRVLWC